MIELILEVIVGGIDLIVQLIKGPHAHMYEDYIIEKFGTPIGLPLYCFVRAFRWMAIGIFLLSMIPIGMIAAVSVVLLIGMVETMQRVDKIGKRKVENDGKSVPDMHGGVEFQLDPSGLSGRTMSRMRVRRNSYIEPDRTVQNN